MAQYATTDDLANLGLPARALTHVTATVQNAHLLAQGDKIDNYLRAQHTLPLALPYPRCLVDCNSVMAAYTILQNHRGFSPADFDDGFRQRYEDCLEMLRDLSSGRASLSATADATPDTNEGRPRVWTGGANRAHGTGDTGASRGW